MTFQLPKDKKRKRILSTPDGLSWILSNALRAGSALMTMLSRRTAYSPLMMPLAQPQVTTSRSRIRMYVSSPKIPIHGFERQTIRDGALWGSWPCC